MRPPDDPEVAEWLEKAGEDLSAARILLGSEEAVHGATCFHCQQAVEKALKAALVATDTPPPRTHDLVRLCEERAELATMEPVIAAARALNAHSVLPRYPGPRSFTRAQAEKAFEHASRAVALLTDLVARQGARPGDEEPTPA